TGGRGNVATVSVKPAKGSKAKPVLVSLLGPSGGLRSLGNKRSVKTTLASTGLHSIKVTNSGAIAGDAIVTVRLKPSRRTLKLLGLQTPAGAQILAAGVASPGATSTVSADPTSIIAGSAVTVPKGALPYGTSILIGSAPPVNPPTGNTG